MQCVLHDLYVGRAQPSNHLHRHARTHAHTCTKQDKRIDFEQVNDVVCNTMVCQNTGMDSVEQIILNYSQSVSSHASLLYFDPT